MSENKNGKYACRKCVDTGVLVNAELRFSQNIVRIMVKRNLLKSCCSFEPENHLERLAIEV